MEKIKCRKISVDSVYNDPVDIRCGGPEYLGFDFFVKEEEVKEMTTFIAESLNKYGVPLKDMYIVGSTCLLSEDKVWTKERIDECIKKDASYLISESNRGYSRKMRIDSER